MTTHLYLAPAGHGKTAYTLERIRQVRVNDPLAPITVILPNQAQVNAFRQRLSAGGGALGVSLGTLFWEIVTGSLPSKPTTAISPSRTVATFKPSGETLPAAGSESNG